MDFTRVDENEREHRTRTVSMLNKVFQLKFRDFNVRLILFICMNNVTKIVNYFQMKKNKTSFNFR